MLTRDKTQKTVKGQTVGSLSLRDPHVGLVFAVKTDVSYPTPSAYLYASGDLI